MYNQNISNIKYFQLLSILIFITIPLTSFSATFTDEGSWQIAAGPFGLETFEVIGDFAAEVTSLASLGVDFSTTHYIYDGRNGGPLFGSYSLITTYPYDPGYLPPFSIRASDGGLITALGLWNASGDDTLYLTFYDADDTVIESMIIGVLGEYYPIFGGIVNSQGASRVEIGGTGNSNRWIAIDNLRVTTQPVPLPAPVLLLGGGIFGLGVLRKRSLS